MKKIYFMKNTFLYKFAFFLLVLVLFFFGLIEARNFLYPIAFGLLLAYLLLPIVMFLEKNRVPRILANLISIIFGIIAIGAIFFFFYLQLGQLINDFSEIEKQAITNIQSLQKTIEEIIGEDDTRIRTFFQNQISLFTTGTDQLSQVFTATTGTIVKILILPIYIFLFLYYRTKFAYFILKIVPPGERYRTINILRDISTVAARYMGGVSIVVIILCILNSIGLWIMGVEYAILFGILSAFFNFIPYFGTLMGGAFPFLFVLLTSSSPLTMGLRVAILFIIIQFTENNILTPNIVGGNVRLNPFFIIIGLVLGATVWGIPGMLVVVPFLAILRIIFKNIDKYHAFSFLLGPRGTKKYAITFSKLKTFLGFEQKNG